MKVYTFFSDPGHGWLRVPREEVERLGVLEEITSYSYQRGRWVYLEEDCDAARFLRAKDAAGEAYRVRFVNSNGPSKIRTYAPFSPRDDGPVFHRDGS